jgi:hypothetical protein
VPVNNFEGHYSVSNTGKVKSHKWGKERLLKQIKNKYGYLTIFLCKNNHKTNIAVHLLVWDAFGNKLRVNKFQVDHKDEDKLNNNILNLQLLTVRQNVSKTYQLKRSLPTGVSWEKKINKYRAKIYIGNKDITLGFFYSVQKAKAAYQNKLREVYNGK